MCDRAVLLPTVVDTATYLGTALAVGVLLTAGAAVLLLRDAMIS